MIESALRTHILADAATAAIVGTKLYPIVVPQTTALPYIVYRRTGTERYTEHGSPGGLATATISLDCWAATYEDVKDLAEAVRKTCDGVAGTIGVYEVRAVMVDDESDLPPDFDTGSENPAFGVQLTVSVNFREES